MLINLTTKVTGNTLLALEWNSPALEFKLLIEGAGQTVGDATNQAELAVAQMASESFYTVGGTASDITLTPPHSVGPELFRTGMLVRWRPAQSAPGGAMSLDLNGMGAKDLTDEAGVDLIASVYDGLTDVQARWDTAADKWFLEAREPLGFNLPNMLDNSDFSVWQHLGLAADTIATARDVTSACLVPVGGSEDYDIPIDRWHLMANGDDVVKIQRDTGRTVVDGVLDAGMRSCATLEVVTANKKFGLLQNVESSRALALYHGTGRKASLSFKLRSDPVTPGNLKKLRSALISITGGTIDVQTATPVSAWNANGSKPTLAGTNVYEGDADHGTPSEGSWTIYKVENIDVDASAATLSQLKVFIWIDDPTDSAAGDLLRISEVKLEPQNVATAYVQDSYAVEEARCMRHFQHLGFSTEIADIHLDGEVIGNFHAESGAASDYGMCVFPLRAPLARAPLAANCFALGDLNLSYMIGAATRVIETVDASNLTFTGFGQSRSFVTANLLVAGLLDIAHTYQIRSDDDVDPDGFMTDGIYVRSQI